MLHLKQGLPAAGRDLNPLSVATLDMPVLNKPLFLQEALV